MHAENRLGFVLTSIAAINARNVYTWWCRNSTKGIHGQYAGKLPSCICQNLNLDFNIKYSILLTPLIYACSFINPFDRSNIIYIYIFKYVIEYINNYLYVSSLSI